MKRVPFEVAIADKRLLKTHFDSLSFPQQVTLKAFYNLPLDPARINPNTGWSELDYWAILQGSYKYDELGFPTEIIPVEYELRENEYEQLWGVVGRRAGKTSSLMATIIAYEAALGGHEEYIKKGQDCIIYLIGHRLGLAQSSIPFVRLVFDSSPLLGDYIEDHNADGIKLKNGILIAPSPPSLKAQRGIAVPVVAMDEVSFWYSDPESANPDFEVERAVAHAMTQFPNGKRIGISTPWSKQGLLWKYHRAGTAGQKLPADERQEYEDILTVFSTTAAFENPIVPREQWVKKLRKLLIADHEAFQRESLCVFPDSVSGFLSRELVEKAAEKGKGVAERPPANPEDTHIIPHYIAAMDPAFRHDSFAFCILHRDAKDGIMVDLLRRWTPIKGFKLNPKEVLAEIKPLAESYNIGLIYTDQYQLESLQQLALDMNMMLEGVDFTARSKSKIFGNLQQLINQQKFVLLDPALSEPARNAVQELIQLERRLTAQGGVQISAPEGKHDDMAAVLALGSKMAVWTEPEILPDEDEYKEPSLFERGMATIRSKQLTNGEW